MRLPLGSIVNKWYAITIYKTYEQFSSSENSYKGTTENQNKVNLSQWMVLEEESYVCLNKIKYLYKKYRGRDLNPNILIRRLLKIPRYLRCSVLYKRGHQVRVLNNKYLPVIIGRKLPVFFK